MKKNLTYWISALLFTLLGIMPVSAATTEHVYQAGSVMTKGLLGIMVSLGIENFVSITDATFLYNLISVSILLFIAAFSGPRSEAAFCVLIPLFAGLFEWFGWLRLSTPADTSGLVVLTICMGMFGVMIYMNDQNKSNYGTLGPGSKIFSLAIFLALFSVAVTLVTGFNLFPAGPTQVAPGTCVAGASCTLNNIDFTTTASSAQQIGGANGSFLSSGTWIVEMGGAFLKIAINVVIGVLGFSLVLNQAMNGVFPGISSNAVYLLCLAAIQGVVWLIYVMGVLELIRPSGGSTL